MSSNKASERASENTETSNNKKRGERGTLHKVVSELRALDLNVHSRHRPGRHRHLCWQLERLRVRDNRDAKRCWPLKVFCCLTIVCAQPLSFA